MCGIVGGVSKNNNIVPILINGLEKLEYRGYDSVGVAIIHHQRIQRIRSVGRVSTIHKKILEKDFKGKTGIGHTRWATHGGVSEKNAHPHISNNEIVVVHNGIIENHAKLCEFLKNKSYKFKSETDTEVIAHLIHFYRKNKSSLLDAVHKTCKKLEGAYAIAVSDKNSNEIIVARNGCPLIIGVSEDQNFIASDISALISVTNNVVFLEDGDIALIASDDYQIFDNNLNQINRKVHKSSVKENQMELGPYNHFMQKEIYEQPVAIADTIESIIDEGSINPKLIGGTKFDPSKYESILILAAGTSYYAGLTAKYWFEHLAKVPVNVEIASEYRYRDVVTPKKQLIITISQSGETLDTLEALKQAKKNGNKHSLTICNVQESAIVRQSNNVFYTRAGVEIGVASTKAFTTQLVCLFVLALIFAKQRKKITKKNELAYIEELRKLSGHIQTALNLEPQIKAWAKKFSQKSNALFLGRGLHYPIALEGALKLKEVSYIHAEAYPAGELKHGPLALVDKDLPVVVIAPNDKLLEKVKSNMQEVKARGGELFVIADADSHFDAETGIHVIRTNRHVGILSPIVHSIPVQLLAYHVALSKKTDVDKPRNLAKSVTVE
ncbi:MAG: glutamine--fructose-6-phosphate transaminase (isomerizing) [Methylophilaceae bacterium]|jgi:glutamine---fructose-6-phosphate transaminase (isomerizing)